jgi:hypothetical protein
VNAVVNEIEEEDWSLGKLYLSYTVIGEDKGEYNRYLRMFLPDTGGRTLQHWIDNISIMEKIKFTSNGQQECVGRSTDNEDTLKNMIRLQADVVDDSATWEIFDEIDNENEDE